MNSSHISNIHAWIKKYILMHNVQEFGNMYIVANKLNYLGWNIISEDREE